MDEAEIREIVRDEYRGIVERAVSNIVVPALTKLVQDRLGKIETEVLVFRVSLEEAGITLINPPPF
jgi:hypothetical protein